MWPVREGSLCRCAGVLFAACVGFAATASAQAQSAEEFFKGKTLRFTVVYEPGGTYDLYSRLLITHLPKHIPGNPTIVIQYMPGAGGMVGTVNLYEKAARDGTQLGMLPRDIAVNQMLHPDNARYDAKRFNWIGRIATYTGVMMVMSRTGVKTADDLRRKDVVVGSWGKTTDSFVTPTLLNALAGTRFKIVTGYRGAADVDLAIERGEADARVASWTALKTTRGEWLKDGRIAVPFQTGLKRHADLPDLAADQRSGVERRRPPHSRIHEFRFQRRLERDSAARRAGGSRRRVACRLRCDAGRPGFFGGRAEARA